MSHWSKSVALALVAVGMIGCGSSSSSSTCSATKDCAMGEICCLVYGVGGPSTGHNQCVSPAPGDGGCPPNF